MILLLVDEVAKLELESFESVLARVGVSLDANCSRKEFFKMEAVFSTLDLQRFYYMKSSSGRSFELIKPLTPIRFNDLKERIDEIIDRLQGKRNEDELEKVVFIFNLLFFTALLMVFICFRSRSSY